MPSKLIVRAPFVLPVGLGVQAGGLPRVDGREGDPSAAGQWHLCVEVEGERALVQIWQAPPNRALPWSGRVG